MGYYGLKPVSYLLLIAVLFLMPLSDQGTVAQGIARDQAPAVPAGTASLTGRVVIVGGAQPAPLRRARVIVQADGIESRTTDTDVNGAFRIERLPPGTYRIVVDKPGFVPSSRVRPIRIQEAQAATATIAMTRAAAIEGRLTAPDGEPAMGVTVSAVRVGYGPYGRMAVAVQQTTTDDLGRFRVHTLPSGEYYLEAAPDPIRMLTVQSAPRGAPRPVRTYFPGTPRLNDAQIVSLTAGQDLSDQTFTVNSAVLSTITGRTLLASGQSPTTYSVRMQPVGAPPGDVRCLAGLNRANDGGFQCPNVPPGDFWLLVTARMAPTADVEYTSARVTVEGRDIEVPPISTALGVSVTGHLEIDGGGPMPANLQVAALETAYEYPALAGASKDSGVVISAADRTFTLPGLAGPRLIRVTRLPEGWALKSVQLDDNDVSDRPIAFAGTVPSSSLRVTVTPRTGSVEGTILDNAGAPAGGARVVVFPEDVRYWGARSRFIRSTTAAPDGHYAIRGLLPGKYLVASVDSLDEGTWEDPDVLTRLQGSARHIVVADSSKLTLDWRVR